MPTTPPIGPRPPAFATEAEAAAYCRLSGRTLRRAVADGRLRAYRVGGRRRFRYQDLDAFVTAAAAAGPGTPGGPSTLRFAEAAEYCGLSRPELARAVNSGHLPRPEAGGPPAFRVEDLDRLISARGAAR